MPEVSIKGQPQGLHRYFARAAFEMGRERRNTRSRRHSRAYTEKRAFQASRLRRDRRTTPLRHGAETKTRHQRTYRTSLAFNDSDSYTENSRAHRLRRP